MSNQTVKSQPKNTPNHVSEPPAKPCYTITNNNCGERMSENRIMVTRLAAYIAGCLAFEYCLSDSDTTSLGTTQRVIEDALMHILPDVDLQSLERLQDHK